MLLDLWMTLVYRENHYPAATILYLLQRVQLFVLQVVFYVSIGTINVKIGIGLHGVMYFGLKSGIKIYKEKKISVTVSGMIAKSLLFNSARKIYQKPQQKKTQARKYS